MSIVAYGYGVTPLGSGATVVVGREAAVSTQAIAVTLTTPAVDVTVNKDNVRFEVS